MELTYTNNDNSNSNNKDNNSDDNGNKNNNNGDCNSKIITGDINNMLDRILDLYTTL